MRTEIQAHSTQGLRNLSAQELLAVGGGLYIVDEWGSGGGGEALGVGVGQFAAMPAAPSPMPSASSTTVQQACYTITLGPVTQTTCSNSDGTTTVTSCFQVGPSGNVGGVGVGVTGSVCESTTTTTTPK